MSGEYETFYVTATGSFGNLDRALERLQGWINSAIDEGFRPAGGLVMTSYQGHLIIGQAVVRAVVRYDPTGGFALTGRTRSNPDEDNLTGELPF